MNKDVTGTEINPGDLLLNIRDRDRDPWDSWAILICCPTGYRDQEFSIRDFNAWNLGWSAEETLIIGPYWEHSELTKKWNYLGKGLYELFGKKLKEFVE